MNMSAAEGKVTHGIMHITDHNTVQLCKLETRHAISSPFSLQPPTLVSPLLSCVCTNNN